MADALAILKKKFVDLKEYVIFDVLQEALNDSKFEIAQLNRDQLRKGMRSDGVKLPNYAKSSVAERGKPAGPIRLYDTGSFYVGINVIVTEEGIEIVNIDSKTKILQAKYGDTILGLTTANFKKLKRETLIPKIGPEIIKRLKV